MKFEIDLHRFQKLVVWCFCIIWAVLGFWTSGRGKFPLVAGTFCVLSAALLNALIRVKELENRLDVTDGKRRGWNEELGDGT